MMMTEAELQDRRLDRRTKLVMYASLLLLLLVIFALPPIFRSASNTDASQRTDLIASCRAAVGAELSEVRAEKAEVSRLEDRAQNRLANLALQAIEAAVYGGEVDALRSQLDAQRHELSRAEQEVDRVTVQEGEATDRYAEVVQLSFEDPDRFLQFCEEKR